MDIRVIESTLYLKRRPILAPLLSLKRDQIGDKRKPNGNISEDAEVYAHLMHRLLEMKKNDSRLTIQDLKIKWPKKKTTFLA